MKSRKRSTIRCLVAAMSVIFSSSGVADVASGASSTRGSDSPSPLFGFLTLEFIMLVAVVLLALVVVARKRKVR